MQAKGLGDTQVQAAQNALIEKHLDLVQHVVNQVSARYPRHVDRQELYNAGAMGLVEAARRYNPDTGVPFPRYAQTRIRGAIIDSTRSRDWAARALRRNLREMKETQEQFEDDKGRTPTNEELAERLGVTAAELESRQTAAVSSSLLHLDHAYPDQDSLGDLLPETDSSTLPEEALGQRELIGTLRTAIQYLPEVQRDVVTRYYLQGTMLQEIAEDMGVTEARVSQICAEAINSVRAYLGELYDGVPEVAANAPGKRNRSVYLSSISTHNTWKARLQAADDASWATQQAVGQGA
ncbi:MAG: sigma-70 family RNA polymerase sigma factor [Actinomycetota bacterium]